MNMWWQFTEYQKMDESTSSWNLEKNVIAMFKRTPWIVLEKIHGANFSFVTDGLSVHCAKRRQLLPDGEDFFGHGAVKIQLEPLILKIFQIVREKKPVKLLTIFGELFGGGYPHPKVPVEENVQPIQTGIFYHPSIKFCAFDILCRTDSEEFYLDYVDSMTIFKTVGIFYAEPLFTGKYEECLNFELNFSSTIPKKFGLPPIPDYFNLAEGIVIKPLKEIIVSNSSLSPSVSLQSPSLLSSVSLQSPSLSSSVSLQSPSSSQNQRAIIKKKNSSFSEDKRYHQAEKWNSTSSDNSFYSLPPFDLISWEIQPLMTENRVISAISKIGRVSLGDKVQLRQLKEEIVGDINSELQKYHKEILQKLTPEENSAISKKIGDEVELLIKLYFKEEIKKIQQQRNQPQQ